MTISSEPSLSALGWDPDREREFGEARAAGLVPGRVVRADRGAVRVRTGRGERLARLPGRLRRQASADLELPAVGDWLALHEPPGDGPALVDAVLPRRSQLLRRAAGEAVAAQVVAANVDAALLVSGLDGEFNPRRIERLLSLTRMQGIAPRLLLNKADLCPDPRASLATLSALAPDAPAMALSALAEADLARLRAWLAPGTTSVLLGASGVGKSTLLNGLLGAAVQPTRPVRARDRKGRHATTRRELFALPGGALLIDTPGLREIGLWAEADELGATFEDVEALAVGCRFRDCRHQEEPGCAVRAALGQGGLEPGRLEAFQRMQRELEDLGQRRGRAGEKARGRQAPDGPRAPARPGSRGR